MKMNGLWKKHTFIDQMKKIDKKNGEMARWIQRMKWNEMWETARGKSRI